MCRPLALAPCRRTVDDMPRPLRDFTLGSVWHLTSHGVDARAIALDDEDRRLWVGLLRKAGIRAQWTVQAWCLRTTHYHLLVEVGPGGISMPIKWLNGTFAQEYNRRHGRRGHLWESRFRAWAVEDADHFDAAVAYVLQNPVRAGLVDDPEDWPWLGSRHLVPGSVVGSAL